MNLETISSFQKPGIGFYDGLLVLRCSFNVGGKDIFLQAGARCSTGTNSEIFKVVVEREMFRFV